MAQPLLFLMPGSSVPIRVETLLAIPAHSARRTLPKLTEKSCA
jgi:hypothetical protein